MSLRVAVRFVRTFAKGADRISKSSRSILPLVSIAGIVAAMLFGSAVSTAIAAASLTPLGDLPGGSFSSQAYGVSGDGLVVVGGGSRASADEAFRWTSGSGMVGLGDLPGGGDYSVARGVSADGSVIVGVGSSTSGGEAFRWTSGGGMVGLGDLPGGEFSSYAAGVSADGSVIVGNSVSVSIPGGFSHSQAFRWTSDGGMVGLGDQPGGDLFRSVASGVSADGSVVVGGSFSASGQREAFRWTSGGGMVGLGDLPGGTFTSEASDVSADGSVIVGVGSSASGFRPFRWTSDGGMVDLGDGPGGWFSLGARAVSADGSVVVGAGVPFGPTFPDESAIYWTADGGMRALWDVLLSHGVDSAADGWTSLGSAEDISADGNTIVGYGTRNGATEAFVAVIPIIPGPAGDFDHDGDVDGEDLLQWQGDFGQNGSSDADGDDDSDGADFLAWQRQLGAGPSATVASTAVPEPATFVLMIVAAAGWCQRRRRTA